VPARRQGCPRERICPEKGVTGGLPPLAATLTTERIFEAFKGPPAEGRTFFHGHTYTGNALASAAALATLDIFEQDHVLERLPHRIKRPQKKVKRRGGRPAGGEGGRG